MTEFVFVITSSEFGDFKNSLRSYSVTYRVVAIIVLGIIFFPELNLIGRGIPYNHWQLNNIIIIITTIIAFVTICALGQNGSSCSLFVNANSFFLCLRKCLKSSFLSFRVVLCCTTGILAWEVYSGGKQPYPSFGNTDVVQQVCKVMGRNRLTGE